MEIGLSLPQWGFRTGPDAIRSVAMEADNDEFASLWVGEHLLWPHDPAVRSPLPSTEYQRSAYAPLETLAYVAAITERVRLGTSVLVVGLHRPVELSKRLATIDQLSHGRLIVGLGIGYSREDHESAGTPYEDRTGRMEEVIGVLRACWSPDPVEWAGLRFRVPRSDISPKPFGGRAIPIILATIAPRGVDQTVRLADGWNPAWSTHSLEDVAALRHTIEDGAARAGRPRPTTHLRGRWRSSIDELVDDVAAAAEAGIDEIILDVGHFVAISSNRDWIVQVRRLADALRGRGIALTSS